MLTSKDLAQLAGVSQITVSRALNNSPLVKPETRNRIIQLAREYHFELNSFAQSLRTNKTGSIGLMLPSHFTHTNRNLYATSILGYLLQEFESSGYNIIPTTNQKFYEDRSNIEIMLAKRKIDGLIVLLNTVSDDVFRMLEFYEIPAVFITHAEPDSRILYSIRLDNHQTGYLVGEYFADKGFTNVSTVAGPSNTPDTMARTRGFLDALNSNQAQAAESHIFYGDYSFEAGYLATKENLAVLKNSQGIYYQNDPCAIGGIKALQEECVNLSAIDIVSGDGTTITEWYSPSLSTVYVPAPLIAKEATDLMCRLLTDRDAVSKPIHIVVQPELRIKG